MLAAASMKAYLGIRDSTLPYGKGEEKQFGIDLCEHNFVRVRVA